MSDLDIKSQIDDVLAKINVLEKELEVLRKTCRHEEYKVDFIENRGTKELVRICRFCKDNIGYPTAQERKDSGFF